MKNKGWVRLHRKIEDNFLWFLEPFTKAQAWIDLFLNANHRPTTIQIRGNIVPLKRGQIGWSELTMAARWTWSKGKVRRFLKLLEIEQQITQQKDRYITTVLTILNYEQMQSDTADNTADGQQTVYRQELKNEKKVKKENKILSSRTSLDTFLIALKENPAYKGIAIDNEIHKMNAWLLTPKGTGRKITHKFILNWLNKCERDLGQPLHPQRGSAKTAGNWTRLEERERARQEALKNEPKKLTEGENEGH